MTPWNPHFGYSKVLSQQVCTPPYQSLKNSNKTKFFFVISIHPKIKCE